MRPNNQLGGGWFKALCIVLLLGKLFMLLIYGAGGYLAYFDGEELPNFEVLRVCLYAIDVIAISMILRGNISGYQMIIATSCAYAIGAWHFGAVTNDILSAYGTYNFYMFVLTATVLPFVDVVLIRWFVKKHITS
jgi:hypothetical protein